MHIETRFAADNVRGSLSWVENVLKFMDVTEDQQQLVSGFL